MLLQSKVQSSLQSIGLNRAEKERALHAANAAMLKTREECQAKVAKIDQELSLLLTHSTVQEEYLRVFQTALAPVYGNLDLAKISYDETSGRIFQLDESGVMIPVLSASSSS